MSNATRLMRIDLKSEKNRLLYDLFAKSSGYRFGEVHDWTLYQERHNDSRSYYFLHFDIQRTYPMLSLFGGTSPTNRALEAAIHAMYAAQGYVVIPQSKRNTAFGPRVLLPSRKTPGKVTAMRSLRDKTILEEHSFVM